MSKISIRAKDARLSVLGYQPEAVKIYWSALPTHLPVYGETLDLTGAEIKAVYADGSEAVVTDYCTFSPATGYRIPNESTLTVTATYTARSGKALQADEILPIVVAAYIKIILPRDTPRPKERIGIRYYAGDARDALLEAMGVHPEVWLFWTQGGEVVKATKLNVKARPYYFWADKDEQGHRYVGVYHPGLVRNVTTTRYYSPTETEERTVTTGLILAAEYTIYGNALTTSTPLEIDGISSFGVHNPPISYEHPYTAELTMGSVRVIYESGDIETADYYAAFPYHTYIQVGDTPINSLAFGFYGPSSWIDLVELGEIVPTKSVNIGGSGSLRIVLAEDRITINDDYVHYEDAEVTYSSSDGTVTWTGAIIEQGDDIIIT